MRLYFHLPQTAFVSFRCSSKKFNELSMNIVPNGEFISLQYMVFTHVLNVVLPISLFRKYFICTVYIFYFMFDPHVPDKLYSVHAS